jgi:multimeric flavodoxin WrbA
MSGQMKVFIDRLTELMYEYKAIGKALKGKKTYLIVCGGGAAMPEGFEVPFKSTSEYFEMQFVRGYYHQLSSSAN